MFACYPYVMDDDAPQITAVRVSAHVKRLREARGLSQLDLATEAGLTKAYVGRIERDQKNVGADTIDALARALGVDPSDLLQPLEDDS